MMMKKAFLFLIGLLIASLVVNIWLMVRGPEVETTIERRTDTVWKDTAIYKPQPAETVQIGRVVYIKVPVQSDTVHDSIEVPVPIVQKRYEDSLYTAWVSGYEPNLDSIRLYQPTITNTVTITNTITKTAPRLSVGIQTGAGIGAFSRQPDIYLGFGVQYNIFRK